MFEPLPNIRGSVVYAGGNEGTVVFTGVYMGTPCVQANR